MKFYVRHLFNEYRSCPYRKRKLSPVNVEISYAPYSFQCVICRCFDEHARNPVRHSFHWYQSSFLQRKPSSVKENSFPIALHAKRTSTVPSVPRKLWQGYSLPSHYSPTLWGQICYNILAPTAQHQACPSAIQPFPRAPNYAFYYARSGVVTFGGRSYLCPPPRFRIP